MSNKKITKLNEYFYMTPEGEIFKYRKYYIINDCKKYLLTIILEKKIYYIAMIMN